METTTQAPFRDSPASSPASSRSSTPTLSSRSLNSKPLPLLPIQQASPVLEPYHDEPTERQREQDAEPMSSTSRRQHHSPLDAAPHQGQALYAPYTDDEFETDDVPLAYLYPYPTEAPPSYHVAVRESFRATLIAHIPRSSVSSTTDVDEEAARDALHTDEARFSMERFVATIVVSMLLVVIAALLALIAVVPFRNTPIS